VGGQLALGDAVIREEHLLRVGDHDDSLVTSAGALSGRRPSRRGWRILPYGVHSRNATWTTTSGRTQWATRGRPVALVNGGRGTSRASSRLRRSSSSAVVKPVPT